MKNYYVTKGFDLKYFNTYKVAQAHAWDTGGELGKVSIRKTVHDHAKQNGRRDVNYNQ